MNLINVLLGLLEITLLDLALCADNIGIIALATRNLDKKSAKLASFLGITGAIILRIYFAVCLSFFLKMSWLPIKLLGGLLLLKVTWDLIKNKPQKEQVHIKKSENFWDAVITVLIADVSMSLDNVLAIAGASNGNIALIFFGIIFNIPIIFFGSQFVMNLMKKSSLIVYISGAVLAYTSVKMILEDYWTSQIIVLSPILNTMVPLIAATLILFYGFFTMEASKNSLVQIKKRKVS
jgi:YjbE family integral membrane protein